MTLDTDEKGFRIDITAQQLKVFRRQIELSIVATAICPPPCLPSFWLTTTWKTCGRSSWRWSRPGITSCLPKRDPRHSRSCGARSILGICQCNDEPDGSELCRPLRSQPALAELPIILLSAMPEPEGEPRCWTVFFRKPADLDALLSTVGTLIAERLGNGSWSPSKRPRRR